MPDLYSHFLWERLLLQNTANFYDSLFFVIFFIFRSKLGPEEFLPPHVHPISIAAYKACGFCISASGPYFLRSVFFWLWDLKLQCYFSCSFCIYICLTSLLLGILHFFFLVYYCFSICFAKKSLCYYVYSSELL